MSEREKHDISCNALSRREGKKKTASDELETLEQMGIWHELVLKKGPVFRPVSDLYFYPGLQGSSSAQLLIAEIPRNAPVNGAFIFRL